MGHIRTLCIGLVLIGVCIGGCAPYTAIRGNFIDPEVLNSVVVGTSSKQDVIVLLGSPTNTDPFMPNRWFFIGEKTESFTFLSPEILDKNVIEIIFDEKGIVTSVQSIQGDHDLSIRPQKRKTKTLAKDPNIFQQLLGNFGKFSRQQKEK